jgi:lysozyme family protein
MAGGRAAPAALSFGFKETFMADNFERCLRITLKWEGGYSNHPDDPGGATMKGIIQREYDAWRKKHRLRRRPVRQIEEEELRAIYRREYWDPCECAGLGAGMDLCMFDAAVNSGVARAKKWLERTQDIDAFCDARLAFLQGLGRLWRVFGAGWRRRVQGIREDAHLMAGQSVTLAPHGSDLHAGMTGDAVCALQEKLRALGYPCGAVDGVFGEQTYRAVILFQHDSDLQGEPGVWLPSYDEVLATAKPMLPKRAEATHRDLEEAGDMPIRHMNFLQRVFAWVFGASAVAQAFEGQSIMDSINGMRSIIEPAQGVIGWLSGNRFLLVAGGCIALIALIRLMRTEHVNAYQNFGYQGAPAASKEVRS